MTLTLLKEAIFMNERQRILDLVKKGIITTEEGLVLLENIAKDKDEAQVQKEADQVDSYHKDQVDDLMDEFEEESQADLEAYYDELATEANQISAKIDEINQEKGEVKSLLADKQEALSELHTKQDFEILIEGDEGLMAELEAEIKELEEQLILLDNQEVAQKEMLNSIHEDQQENRRSRRSHFDIPEDLKEQATETFTQVGEKLGDAGLQLGRLMKKTFKTISDTVEDNVDWKDFNVKVPGVASTKFEHQFLYTEVEPTLIDVKLANGKVIFKSWDDNDIKIDAKIKLYGKMNEASPIQSFMERSQIEVDNEHISFQVPNKRVHAELTFYLPNRTYDHVAVKLLNGNFTVEELNAKDVYAKSTNGNITFKQINATMLEIEGVNGNIEIQNGEILDSIIETVNGTIIGKADVQNYGISLINGDIKLTAKNDSLRKVKASAVNGTIKVSLPTNIGLEGIAKTSFGNINQRLSEVEVVREKKDKTNRLFQFRRLDDAMSQIDLTTTTGSIFLKDYDA